MKTSLFSLYTTASQLKQRGGQTQKTLLSTDKHTFVQARGDVDFNYNGCYNADDDHADYAHTLKAVRIA
ncbi:hypothetical protein [uncultured Planococcus sp.]|uniref:hypothetical protein n=1 Tax=uncultured Planococcus sp. TaxID=337815 RepID=UPI00262241FC|nr:hypothetical protein [uncultured Planococcus sp.]